MPPANPLPLRLCSGIAGGPRAVGGGRSPSFYQARVCPHTAGRQLPGHRLPPHQPAEHKDWPQASPPVWGTPRSSLAPVLGSRGDCRGSLGTLLSPPGPPLGRESPSRTRSRKFGGGCRERCTCCIYFTYGYKYTLIFLICIPCPRGAPGGPRGRCRLLEAPEKGLGGPQLSWSHKREEGWGWRRD